MLVRLGLIVDSPHLSLHFALGAFLRACYRLCCQFMFPTRTAMLRSPHRTRVPGQVDVLGVVQVVTLDVQVCTHVLDSLAEGVRDFFVLEFTGFLFQDRRQRVHSVQTLTTWVLHLLYVTVEFGLYN